MLEVSDATFVDDSMAELLVQYLMLRGLTKVEIFSLINTEFTLKQHSRLVFLLYNYAQLCALKQSRTNKRPREDPGCFEVRVKNVASELICPWLGSGGLRYTYMADSTRRHIIFYFLATSWLHLHQVTSLPHSGLFVETCYEIGIDPFRQQWLLGLFSHLSRG